MVIKVEFTETELRYLFGMVADDINKFHGSLENRDQQRSRFTTDGLDALFDKLNPENWEELTAEEEK